MTWGPGVPKVTIMSRKPSLDIEQPATKLIRQYDVCFSEKFKYQILFIPSNLVITPSSMEIKILSLMVLNLKNRTLVKM